MERKRKRCLTTRGAGVLAVALLAGLAAGCGDGGSPERPAAKAPPPPSSGSSAITVALLPERNVFDQKKRYQPLQDYLSGCCGARVTFKLLDNYQVIFSELLERRVDGAFFGSMNGAIAQLKGGVEILARPVDLDGVSTYSGLIFTRSGSRFTADPKSWRGARMAFVNKVTTAGYLYPLSLLRKAGIAADPAAYFSKTTFTGSHDAAILAVFNGEADLGACKNTIFHEYLRLHPEVGAAVTVLSESAPVPSNGLGMRPDVDPEVKSRLRAALLAMHTTEDGQRALRQFQAQRFVETTSRDYEPVFAMAREAGLDLAGWPLRDIH